MGKTIIRAILLVGLGVIAGIVHARVRPLMTLQTQPSSAAQQAPAQPAETAPESRAGATAPVQAPEPARTAPEAAPREVAPPPVAAAPAQSAPETPAAPAPSAEQPSSEVAKMISVEEAKAFFDNQATGAWQGYFIDARRFVEFRDGHIRGSMHLDKKYFDGAVPKKVRNFLPGSAVVIYCHGEQCTDSEAVAKRLVALKLNIGPLYILKEGYPGWVKAGHPVDEGPEVGFED